jgi:poly(ADP-ribose) glycohydrolase
VYNATYEDDWTFNGLNLLITKMDQPERDRIFSYTIPGIIQLALALPDLMGDERIPVLSSQRTISLTQRQVASLLANAFLCTFPRRNAVIRNADVPTINFSALFSCTNTSALHKMSCILNYFNRVIKNVGEGTISFHKRVITKFPDWPSKSIELQNLVVHAEGNLPFVLLVMVNFYSGSIEDSDPNFLHVDFSNKYIGGGVLSRV